MDSTTIIALVSAVTTAISSIVVAIINRPRREGPDAGPPRSQRKRWLATALAIFGIAFSVTAVALTFYRLNTISIISFANQSDAHSRFVANYGSPGGKDPNLSKSDGSGVTTDCSTFSPPSQAHGAIVTILLVPGAVNHGAFFMPANSAGSISGWDFSPGLANYNSRWIGGVAFCPFLEGTKKIKWTVRSEPANPDLEVGCVGRIIGWF